MFKCRHGISPTDGTDGSGGWYRINDCISEYSQNWAQTMNKEKKCIILIHILKQIKNVKMVNLVKILVLVIVQQYHLIMHYIGLRNLIGHMIHHHQLVVQLVILQQLYGLIIINGVLVMMVLIGLKILVHHVVYHQI
eukprot:UN02626